MGNEKGSSEMETFVNQFITSYLERDPSEDFSVWLSRRLAEELPGLSAAESEALTVQILAGVAQYDKTLAEVNEAAAAGQAKEEWLAEKLADSCAALPPEQAGQKLQQIEGAMASSNAELMGETVELAPQPEDAAWNKYSLKAKAKDVAEQAAVTGLAVSADLIRQNRAGGEDARQKEEG